MLFDKLEEIRLAPIIHLFYLFRNCYISQKSVIGIEW
jgi:hypothetical protein